MIGRVEESRSFLSLERLQQKHATMASQSAVRVTNAGDGSISSGGNSGPHYLYLEQQDNKHYFFCRERHQAVVFVLLMRMTTENSYSRRRVEEHSDQALFTI
jgi:hypothetical protein